MRRLRPCLVASEVEGRPYRQHGASFALAPLAQRRSQGLPCLLTIGAKARNQGRVSDVT
jgi:hypothetical protein